MRANQLDLKIGTALQWGTVVSTSTSKPSCMCVVGSIAKPGSHLQEATQFQAVNHRSSGQDHSEHEGRGERQSTMPGRAGKAHPPVDQRARRAMGQRVRRERERDERALQMVSLISPDHSKKLTIGSTSKNSSGPAQLPSPPPTEQAPVLNVSAEV